MINNCPSGHCLCRTLQEESTNIWRDLGDANTLNSPLHENSITHYLSLNLNRFNAQSVSVHTFKPAAETKNGSDFLWIIRSPDGARKIILAIQAKRIFPNGQYDSFSAHQVDKVIRYASVIGGFGLYLTYNFEVVNPAVNPLWGNWVFRLPLELCFLPRDAGLAMIHASDLIVGPKRILSRSTVVQHGFPAWLPFCTCQDTYSLGSDPLLAVSKTLAEMSHAGDQLDAQGYISDWSGLDADLLKTTDIQSDDEAYSPDFAVITTLSAPTSLGQKDE